MSWIHPIHAGGGGGERTGRGRAPSRRGGAALAHQLSALARAPSAAAGGVFSARAQLAALQLCGDQLLQGARGRGARQLPQSLCWVPAQRRGRYRPNEGAGGVGGRTGGAPAAAPPSVPRIRPSTVKSPVVAVSFSAGTSSLRPENKVWKHLGSRSNILPAPAVFLEVAAHK